MIAFLLKTMGCAHGSVRVILQKLIAVCGWLLDGVILLLGGGLGSAGNGPSPGVLAVRVDGHKWEAITTIEATIAKSVDLSIGLTLAQVNMADRGGTWDRYIGGIDTGSGFAPSGIAPSKSISQPWLGLSFGFTLPEVASGAWDRLVGSIHAGGRLAVDNREAISVDTTIAQPGLGSGGSHSGEHSNEGLHFLVRYKKEKLLWKRLK